MIGQSATSVTKQYNWRGKVVGYRLDTAFIPWAEGNTDFCAVRERIERGECAESEPEFSWAHKVVGEDGRLTGYDTDLGFVPDDARNPLLQLLMRSHCAGTCVLEEPKFSEPHQGREVATLLLCNIFDRRWHHLEGPVAKLFPYRPLPGARELEILVRIGNIPPNSEDVVGKLREYFDLADDLPAQFFYKPLQLGVIEVEVPTKKLQKIFRNERGRLPEIIKPFLEDSLALHLARSGRSTAKGPNTQWLLMEARYFLAGFFADMVNVAVRAFTIEFGGVPPGHLLEADLLKSNLVFARDSDGKAHLHSFQHQGEHSFALSGRWPDGGTTMALRDVAMRKERRFWDIASRVRQLISAGFAIEAIVVANALIESILKEALIAATSHNGEARPVIEKMSHKDRLKLLAKIAENGSQPGVCDNEFHQFIKAAAEINLLRNDYAHELALPVEDAWKIVDMDRIADRLLRFVRDPHLASVTVGRISWIAERPTDETRSLILSELEISTE